MSTQDLRVTKTKESLRAALMELLTEKPLEKVAVTELCQRAGITRRTFYLHYESVAKLLEAIIEELLLQLEASLRKTSQQRQHAQATHLQPQMISLFHHVAAHRQMYRYIFSASSQFSIYKRFYERIKTIVRQSLTDMEIKQEVREFYASYNANAVLGLIMEWSEQEFQQTATTMASVLVEMMELENEEE
ncbi:TetR/AcrR family transcriptional regulator [Paenibacillus yanchengensis]|uniref:TetR/AcrR family transcriptional regulator n=1 Tax=Paenibacillus yanchengensis TaxID=2035833 RepID=A0ABW4YPR9_9BACL